MTRLEQSKSKRNKARLGFLVVGLFILGPGFLGGCSSENVFEILEQPDARSRGETALSNGDYDEAIKNLEAALASDPNDLDARKMLATAYMARSGLDTFAIVQGIAGAEEDADWPALVASMPDGSAKTRESLQKAVETLSVIPAEQRTEDARYQLAMAQAALAVSTAKKYGADDAGQVSEEQASQITDEDAELVMENLSGASDNLTSLSDPTAVQGGEKMGTLADRIENAEGATPSERLQSFLASERQ